ncbi:glycyl-radical enzyme activating protein [Thermoanaerobacteraceae bacterium SP2]|jgi:pyruvate formate lyase activating enzyme|nr:glycyl-radical enzyme activating protein [Thermoanaerobacteraceae bacterium SP2]
MAYNCNELESGKTGMVFEIERYAIHDGPGIRTLVFLKGCPLRCLWCANPESQIIEPQLVYWKKKCLGCKNCIKACPEQALTMTPEGINIDHEKCNVCGKCASACNAEALVLIGRIMSVQEVFAEILKDEHFYRKSGGGVTFSGGEPLHQIDFLVELAKLCKNNYIHTCIETSGFVPWENMKRAVPYIDLFLYDFKTMNHIKHKEFTGVSNEIILDNFKHLVELKKNVVVRIPVIPGLNDDEENYLKLIEFLNGFVPGNRIDLLPYHRLGVSKYNSLNKDYKLRELEPPPKEKMEAIRRLLIHSGFEVTIGGL